MVTSLFRTIFIYTFITIILRLMGKRHIGELEISELVGTLLISEVASMPIENQDIPACFAIIPIITIATIEIAMSIILIKFPRLKNFVSTRPGTLIEKGVLDQKELTRSRLSIEELISELRQQGITDLADVNYAVHEPNGKISVLTKSSQKPLCASDVGIAPEDKGIMHVLISNGYINHHNLRRHSKTKQWLEREVLKHNCTIAQTFLFLIDDIGGTYIIRKDGN